MISCLMATDAAVVSELHVVLQLVIVTMLNTTTAQHVVVSSSSLG